MRRRAGLWAAGLLGSTALHAGAGMLYLATRSLEPPPRQSGPESQFALDTVTALTESAEATAPDGEAAREGDADSSALGAAAIPRSDARPLRAEATSQSATSPTAEVAAVAATSGQSLSSIVAETDTLDATPPPIARAPEVSTPAATLPVTNVTDGADNATATNVPEATTLAPTVATAAEIAAATPSAARVTTEMDPNVPVLSGAAPVTLPVSTQDIQAAVLPSSNVEPVAATPAAPEGTETAALAATTEAAQPLPTEGATAPEPPLPETDSTATLAWAFGDRLVTDPQALATIQAFMAPQAIENADAVKDNLADVLGGMDCARLSAAFIPETGALELRGHVPDPSMRDQVLAAMQAQVGDGLPVTANLLHLPAPQCGALTGIAEVGLPQSTDQYTDARTVGATAHAREYRYTEGQQFTFDLQAADYDAFVYVDYFDAAGQVIHLQPNLTGNREIYPAKSTVSIRPTRPGTNDAPILIGPPFGQEIAVAFTASRRLYDEPRPVIEPAGPYLDWLKERVAEARATDPNFKGEWVYVFITTRPATQ